MAESSFPYLRFARLHGLDYGTVLRAADYMSPRDSAWGVFQHFKADVESLSPTHCAALVHVVAHEYDRRKALTDGNH